jgi:hypothetical protein
MDRIAQERQEQESMDEAIVESIANARAAEFREIEALHEKEREFLTILLDRELDRLRSNPKHKPNATLMKVIGMQYINAARIILEQEQYTESQQTFNFYLAEDAE